ncbi:MAG: hypothetical protein V2I37_07740 [Marinilabiliaceae bacterium]|jgi:hypothetical protein|nr:hypothetical protein [Marinilabiliaceae bacterium]
MTRIDIEKYKEYWKQDNPGSKELLSKEEIQGYLSGTSRNISTLFRKGLIADIILKMLCALSLVVLLLFYSGSNRAMTAIVATLVITVLLIWYQVKSLKLIPGHDSFITDMRSSLQSRINYYYRRHIKSLLNGGLTNSILIIAGSLYYFYFKYGEIRAMETDDYIVFSSFILLGFLFGSLVQIYHHNFHIRQLKECLEEIDSDTISRQLISKQKNRRRRILWIAILAITCGLLLLSYLIVM